MKSGSRRAQEFLQLARLEHPAGGRRGVADQALVARAVLAQEDHRGAHRRMRGDRRLDLAQLDAEAAQLDLEVDPAQELDLGLAFGVHPVAHQVAGAVEAGAGVSPKASGTNFSAVRAGRPR